MKTKKVGFEHKGKKFLLEAKECNIFSSGLMFRNKNTKPCLFKFKKPSNFDITSLFVFFPFVAVWLDSKDKVIETRLIKPFTIKISCKKPFRKLLEIPINKKYKSKIKFLVGD